MMMFDRYGGGCSLDMEDDVRFVPRMMFGRCG